MTCADDLHTMLLECVRQKGSLMRVVRVSRSTLEGQAEGHIGRFGWLPPHLSEVNGESCWTIAFSPEIVAAQTQGFSDDLLDAYINGISIFAHGMMTYMSEHGCSPGEAENRTEDKLADASPTLLTTFTHAQMRILDGRTCT